MKQDSGALCRIPLPDGPHTICWPARQIVVDNFFMLSWMECGRRVSSIRNVRIVGRVRRSADVVAFRGAFANSVRGTPPGGAPLACSYSRSMRSTKCPAGQFAHHVDHVCRYRFGGKRKWDLHAPDRLHRHTQFVLVAFVFGRSATEMPGVGNRIFEKDRVCFRRTACRRN